MEPERYELIYEAELFEYECHFEFNGIKYSYIYFDKADDAWELYNYMVANDISVELHDHEYGVSFKDGEWY